MTRKDLVLLWVFCLALATGLAVIVHAAVAHAQIIDPLSSQQAYTTDDPNNPDRLGLATLTGRYSISVVDCDWLASGQNITIWPEYNIPPWLGVGPLGTDAPGCLVKVNGRMSQVQCFQDDFGVCDVSVELT